MNTITLLKSKLHRVKVTDADLNYEGSCGIDSVWMKHLDIRPYERIEIFNVNNGERFSTYAIPAERNSGTIQLNGAAARKAAIGDIVIIVAYEQAELDVLPEPKVLFFNSEDSHSKAISLEHRKIITRRGGGEFYEEVTKVTIDM